MTFQQFTNETSLLERIARADKNALSQLYDRYGRILYALSFKILGSQEEAEEVVLDVFSQVWRIAQRYDPKKGKVDAWLFTLTRSRALDRLRILQRHEKTATASMEAALTPSQSTANPEEDLLIAERRDRILAAMAQLPIEQREVLELAYYQGLTHTEIATQTGKSLGTVKTRIRLGLEKLRLALSSWQFE
ncbi:MAG TPA: RNA polymerase [Cyanobacteria bacterium UBA11149]|nr:RNA polymerase [Cyanobacteria bacterium UBA11367]HBE58031.1 RNA polymerase [Cyanobacteria bacterium UBA11366]HBK66264.1 RNA polymerase [Cyanobacteria bacterium UBA11166]HBR72422.1 RNA polymerase [Cyanobacteria bacterium UBA11159]HBS71953.1 RNA polymerase [Cyanobacteria bacterium UBA11153]HBW90545.1 RNA polymerase [Cyanobacteria bacterium UBA11149]HCA93934.1 RNA polymerase [Cyanobacteria bacterium UBA9226]